MATDRSYVAANERERRRLEALVAKLDDGALSRAMPAGWTVSGVLAHLAFYDHRIVLLVDHLKKDETVRDFNHADVDLINDAAKPTQLALPPRKAAELAVAAARAADGAVESLTDEQLAKNTSLGTPIFLERADHRREHLDEIDRALGGG